MSITYGPNLGIMSGAADGDLYGDAMRAFQRGVDSLVMPVVKGVGTNTPPGSPSDGDAYVVGTSPTGAWAAKNNQIARWTSVANAWEFYVPKAGWKVQDSSATGQPSYTFTGSAWTTLITTTGGINFGQTDLKNYQEGTWTPVITAGTTAPAGVTYSFRLGRYTRIGNKVFCQMGFYLSSKGTGGSGAVVITGLPFVSVISGPYQNPIFRAAQAGGLTIADYAHRISFFVEDGSNKLVGRVVNNGDVPMDWTDITDGTFLVFSFFYDA